MAEAMVPGQHEQVVVLEQVRKEYGRVVGVDVIDLAIARGEIVGIIGPSGSGKTTTIRLLLGLEAPTSGAVRIFGRDPVRFTRVDRERIGYLPQHFALYPELTVWENLAFVAGLYGLGWRARRRRIPALLELMRLTGARGRLAAHLSGGMQRRLALASALIHQPELVVLDEPTAGIDPVLRSAIWEVFRDLQAQGDTLVVTTQYVTEAEYCDRVLLIDQGAVIAAGTPEQLRKQAFGGDVVRATIIGVDRDLIAELRTYDFIRRVEWVGDSQVLLVVDSAGEAVPKLTARLRDRDRAVSAIEEHREPFDRVFVELVERNGNAARPAA